MNPAYLKYIKPRYDNDPEFRLMMQESHRRYISNMRAVDPEFVKERQRAYSKKYYDTHPEYRLRKKTKLNVSQELSDQSEQSNQSDQSDLSDMSDQSDIIITFPKSALGTFPKENATQLIQVFQPPPTNLLHESLIGPSGSS